MLSIFTKKLFQTLLSNLKPFYDLLQENIPLNWSSDCELLFQQLKTARKSDTELTIPAAKHPFFDIVGATLIALGGCCPFSIQQR